MLNFNQERLKLVDALTQMQHQINALKQDLEHYKQKPNASEKYIFFKQQQIKVFETVMDSFNEHSNNVNQIFAANQKKISKLETQNFKLIGVCILHGINNLNSYLRQETNSLILLVKDALKNNWRQTPFEIMHAEEPKQTNLKTTQVPTVPYTDLLNKALEK